MRTTDLSAHELLEFNPDGGVIRFAGQRALLIDAVAMGLLRKYLAENFGFTAARIVLTQFGFAHGWRMADAIREQFKWASVEDWRLAGPRLNTLEGLFRLAPGSKDAHTDEGALLVESYEAEQHLLHFGRSDAAACWTISGLMSGYLSRTQEAEIYVLENRCIARGDAACHHLARARDEWGDEHADALRFFESDRLEESLEVSLQRVADTLKAAEKQLQARRRAVVEVARDAYEPLGLVAKSPAMRNAVDMARRVAQVDSTILITGESGSGKERIARLVHAESTRAAGPFIAVNCGAITETLLESELFGHARGAFTGASHDRPGLFEAANHGTLLLDELGEISSGMQVKLLRVLQERRIDPVGGDESIPVDFRLVTATHVDLARAVQTGRFRLDLFFRLNVIPIALPSLRERPADVAPLAEHFLRRLSLQYGRSLRLEPDACERLSRFSWPGNIRQLQNLIERAVIQAESDVVSAAFIDRLLEREADFVSLQTRTTEVESPEHARTRRQEAESAYRPYSRVEASQRSHIVRALDRTGGNRTRAAALLGLTPRQLRYKLTKLAIESDSGTRHD